MAVMTLASLVWYSCTKEEEDLKGTIYGTVTDYSTGNPIGNASVKLRPSGETTLTGSDGTYEFKDLDAGKYTMLLSKAEYADLDDDYVIELEAGKKVKRDVQMKKLIASLQITDMNGHDITSLDFGMTESVTSKSFNIFNNGTMNINCQLSYNCTWINSVSTANASLSPGQTLTVTVIIDRTKLSAGENRTYLHIVSNNGSNELLVTAIGYSTPTVTTSNVSSITATSASCGGNVTADGGTAVTERGLCWSTSNAPTVEAGSHIANGTGTGSFTAMMSGLTPNTVYYVRAYATNARGTAYGEQKQFTTQNGLPTVTINNVTNITATSAVCGGSISSNGGFAVSDKGLVWSTSQYPTLSDNHVSLGSGDAPFMGSMTNLSTGVTYYVRTYATNANGTSYSEQRSFSIDLDYLALPTFQFNGHTYRVAPDPHTSINERISWSAANAYCENLTAYGYSDWRMPTLEELQTMYNNRATIGGFINVPVNSDISSHYHSATECSGSTHYRVRWWDGAATCIDGLESGYYDASGYGYTNLCLCHVRPIRMEN